ncbi:hypothetical protein AB0I54_34325 [Streptomyces sp. NPDC050625]|uniref:hypothetical protein n=1 Tax=Streptomyces sp. NPDC050625 TaxID=3154629 RepID=UPI00343E22E7
MARDRTARARIKQYLVQHGPLADGHGLATKVLKEAVGYEGSPVAFIQLLAAMERDGELVREIRGKRTYRITAVDLPDGLGEPSSGVLETPAGRLQVDYDVLARHLLRELAGSGTPAVIQELTAEQQRIAAERDDYARRLVLARARLEELRAQAGITPAQGASSSARPDPRR